jgi:hypothetical protein
MCLLRGPTKGQTFLTNSGDSLATGHDTTALVARPRKRFVLLGHSAVLDPAIHAVRDDLADVELADRVFAPHYAKALACRATVESTVHVKPNVESDKVDDLSVGVFVDLFDLSAGWGWIRTAKGMGYVPADCIAPA